MKKELELRKLLEKLSLNKDYKKIKKHISEIDSFLKFCESKEIILSDSSISAANSLQKKLMGERNLRYNTLELESKPITYKVLDEYTEF